MLVSVLKQTIQFTMTIILAHWMAFFLSQYLPSTLHSLYGLNALLPGFDQQVGHSSSTATSDYFQYVLSLISLDFGKTVNGLFVSEVLKNSLISSMPIVLTSIVAILILQYIVISLYLRNPKIYGLFISVFDFLSFLPGFLFPLILIVVFIYGFDYLWSPTGIYLSMLGAISMAIIIGPIIISQSLRVSNKFRNSLIYKHLVLNNCSPNKIKKLLYIHLINEQSSTYEKLFVALILGLIYTESIFGIHGFGLTCLNALQFNDLNLIVGCIVVIAFIVSCLRVINYTVSRHKSLQNEGSLKIEYLNDIYIGNVVLHIIGFVFFLAFSFILFSLQDKEGMWGNLSFINLLGKDELGNDILSVILVSISLSLIKSIWFSFISLFFVFCLVVVTYKIRNVITPLLNAVDSIPSVLWLMVALTFSVNQPFLIVSILFIIVLTPSLYVILVKEYYRIHQLGFIQISYNFNFSFIRVLFKHLIPTMLPVIFPILIQLFGISLVIDGVTGLFGIGSRSDLSLGMITVKSKELFPISPQFFIIVLLAYIGIYFWLAKIKKSITGVQS